MAKFEPGDVVRIAPEYLGRGEDPNTDYIVLEDLTDEVFTEGRVKIVTKSENSVFPFVSIVSYDMVYKIGHVDIGADIDPFDAFDGFEAESFLVKPSVEEIPEEIPEEKAEEEAISEEPKDKYFAAIAFDDVIGYIKAKNEDEAYEKLEKAEPELMFSYSDGAIFVDEVPEDEVDFEELIG